MAYLEYKIGKSRIILVRGDITRQVTYAIVNAANNDLSPGGGVSGAIHKMAGPGLWEECKKLGFTRTGEAKLTRGYDLPARYVIHAVGPVYSGKSSDKSELAQAYRSSLEIASKNNIKSISFPSISTGIYGYPVKEASGIALSTIVEYLKSHPEIQRVRMVLFSENDFKIYACSILKALSVA